jgi:hypothetical protein
MKRRDFLAATCAAGLVSLSETAKGAACCASMPRQFYELRHYQIKSAEKQKIVLDFLEKAAIPAMNRIGIKHVGVFQHAEGDSADLYVLVSYENMEWVLASALLIESDPKYQKAGAKLLGAPKSDPAYERIESSLMLAFEAAPILEFPSKKKSRIFQLRIYESHNELAGKKKVEMFNSGGEMDIFRKTGMNPVFFGQALVGTKLPNLTYMLGFDNMDAKEKAWSKFRIDPDWLKLKANPYYKDTVSNITNIMLHPAACSQM